MHITLSIKDKHIIIIKYLTEKLDLEPKNIFISLFNEYYVGMRTCTLYSIATSSSEILDYISLLLNILRNMPTFHNTQRICSASGRRQVRYSTQNVSQLKVIHATALSDFVVRMALELEYRNKPKKHKIKKILQETAVEQPLPQETNDYICQLSLN